VTKSVLCLIATLTLSGPLSSTLRAQELNASVTNPVTLPDAPVPRLSANWSSSDQSSQSATPATPPQQPDTQQETPEQRHAKAEEELKKEESQRMLGIVPAFNSVIGGHAEPLSPGQKFTLFFKSISDPYQFAIVAVDTGLQEAEDSYPGYHHRVRGLLRNYGAAYLDDFDGNLFGNAILPSLLHQDPRYYRLGHGKILHRVLYAASTTVMCKGDNGKWQPNYSNVFGNLIGGAISNAYYPAENRGIGLTIDHGLTVSAEGAVGAQLLEFYPDIAAHFKRKHQQKLDQQALASASRPAQDPTPPATVPSK
jgi:hypothetical protein